MSFTGKIENLAETPIFKYFFIFVANVHHFQKCQFLIEILSFLKEISSVFESVNFWWRCFLLVKNNLYMHKSSVFGQMSEILSPVIKWCRVNFEAEFWCKNVNFVRKELKFGRNVDFFIKCGLLLKVIIFLQNVLIFRKKWLLVWRFIYDKVSNSDKKNFNFFGYVNLYMC